MATETGGGNYPPNEEGILREKIYKSWDVWQGETLVDQLDRCFPDQGKDFWAVNNLALVIVKNHEFLVVNTGKDHRDTYPQYEHSKIISAPNLNTSEQKRTYTQGVANGLSWLKDVPPLLQRYALDPLDGQAGPIVRTLPLWDDKSKPLTRQSRILLNYSGNTTSWNEKRGAANEHTLIMKINPNGSSLSESGKEYLTYMRAFNFGFMNATSILNPKMAQKFFDFQTGNADSTVRVINFTDNFAGRINALPNPITQVPEIPNVRGQDFANYITNVGRIQFEGGRRFDFEGRVERLVPSS